MMTASFKLLWAFVALLLVVPVVPLALAQTNATPVQVQGFNVLTSIWGTTATPAYPGPGDQNVPLTVTLQYFFNPAATYVSAVLQLPPGLTNADGTGSSTVSYLSGSVAVSATVSFTFYVDISSSASAGIYAIPLTINWGVIPVGEAGTQSVSLEQQSTISIDLRGSPTLQVTALQSSLIPGQANIIQVLVANQGSGNVTQISTAISVTSTATQASSQTINVLTKLPVITSLPAGAQQKFNLTIFAATSAAGSSVSLSFAFSFTNAYGSPGTSSQSVGVYVNQASKGALSFEPLQDSLAPGATNTLNLVLSNDGTTSVSQVFTTATATSGSVSILSQLPLVASLAGGARSNASLLVYVPSSAAGAPVTITLTTTFDDASGYGESLTQAISLFVTNSASQSATVAVTSKVSSLTVGQQSNLEFVVTNIGSVALYSPTFTLTASSPWS